MCSAYIPENNPFETLMVDVTNRCNMHCSNCYLPDRSVPDADIESILDAIARLPRRTNIRLAGGEPTLRKDLPEIIARIRSLGHRVVVLTNGLKLARPDYVSELHDAGLRHVYISMNGADCDDWYQKIDNMRCADRKVRALENVIAARMIPNTGTILSRGVNEGAVARIYDLVSRLQPRHALLRFKNIGALGRYDKVSEAANLGMTDMLTLVSERLQRSELELNQFRSIKTKIEPNSRLFSAIRDQRAGQGVWFKITDWQADQNGQVDSGSSRRGRISRLGLIVPFFEDVRNSNNVERAA